MSSVESLRQIVGERKKRLKGIKDFMTKAVSAVGVTTHYETHNDFIEQTQVVHDLRGFDLVVDDEGTYRWSTDYTVDFNSTRVLDFVDGATEKVRKYEQGPWEGRFTRLMHEADAAFEAHLKKHPELAEKQKHGNAAAKHDSDRYYADLAYRASFIRPPTPEQERAEREAKEKAELETEAKKLGLLPSPV